MSEDDEEAEQWRQPVDPDLVPFLKRVAEAARQREAERQAVEREYELEIAYDVPGSFLIMSCEDR